jgi:hypothetical protein
MPALVSYMIEMLLTCWLFVFYRPIRPVSHAISALMRYY